MTTPNFNDPRIQQRCTRLVTWLEQFFKDQTQRACSRRLLDDYFGQQQNAASKWLRAHLLVVEDNWYNMQTGRCKQYSLNRRALAELKQLLAIDTTALQQQSIDKILDQGVVYTEKSDRLFNPIQFYKREVRNPVFARRGYIYDYDIHCASAQVILQLAEPKLRQPLTVLEDYINRKDEIRQQLCEELALDSSQVKRMLTSMLLGAYASTYHTNSIFALVNFDHKRLRAIQSNAWLKMFTNDISRAWRAIVRCEPNKPKKTTARFKSEIYRREERRIGRVVERYLKKHKVDYIWYHDGWISKQAVNLMELQTAIRNKTGYDLAFALRTLEL